MSQSSVLMGKRYDDRLAAFQAFGRQHAVQTMPIRRHMLWSFLSCSTSPTNRMTVLLPVFCHQWEVPLVSGRISPALCTMGAVLEVHITRQQQTHRLRHVVSQLVRYLPDDVRKPEAVQKLAAYGCDTQMHVVRLLARRLENENHTKDIHFTPSGIRMRREAGVEATMRALRQAPWEGDFDAIEGVILHESMPDLAIAAE